MPVALEKPDCCTCGCCCVSTYDQESFCDVTEEDLSHFTPAWIRRNVVGFSVFDMALAMLDNSPVAGCPGALRTKWTTQKAGPLKGLQACTCFALRGSLLSKVSCSIYENRPHACREAIKPGNKVCKQLRRTYLKLKDENHG